MADNDIDADVDAAGPTDPETPKAGPRWLPPAPDAHRRRTMWSLAGTVVLLAVLTISVAAAV